MNTKDFMKVFANQMSLCESTLCNKHGEYATDFDELLNFKQGAATLDTTPKQVLAGYMVKHTQSIYHLIKEDHTPADGIWDEKITDHINYLILLKALIVEETEIPSEALSEYISEVMKRNENDTL